MNCPLVSRDASTRSARGAFSTTGVCARSPTAPEPRPSATIRLRARATDAIEFIETAQHVARLGAIRRTEHAGGVQLVDDARRAAVAHLEPSLQQRCRTLLVLHDHLGRFAEQLVALARGLGAFAIGCPLLERLLRAHLLENVLLDLERLLEH